MTNQGIPTGNPTPASEAGRPEVGVVGIGRKAPVPAFALEVRFQSLGRLPGGATWSSVLVTQRYCVQGKRMGA